MKNSDQKVLSHKGDSLDSWKQVLIVGGASLIAIGAVVAPIVMDLRTLRINLRVFLDVSESNVKYLDAAKNTCEDLLVRLTDEDSIGISQFADKVRTKNNQTYRQGDLSQIQAGCRSLMVSPDNFGKQPGADMRLAIESAKKGIQQGKVAGDDRRNLTVIVQQSADKPGHPMSPDAIKADVETLVKDGGVVLWLVNDAQLEQQLNTALVNVPRTKVCTYDADIAASNQSCLAWAFSTVRKR